MRLDRSECLSDFAAHRNPRAKKEKYIYIYINTLIFVIFRIILLINLLVACVSIESFHLWICPCVKLMELVRDWRCSDGDYGREAAYVWCTGRPATRRESRRVVVFVPVQGMTLLRTQQQDI